MTLLLRALIAPVIAYNTDQNENVLGTVACKVSLSVKRPSGKSSYAYATIVFLKKKRLFLNF